MTNAERDAGVSKAGPLTVRWLAEMCGLPPVSILPHLASAMVAQEEHAAKVVAHIAWWSRHADRSGNFGRSAHHLPDADAERVAALSALGYDGLMYREDDAIVGHFFFQKHDSGMHAFAAWTDEAHRGDKLMATAAMDFLAHASQSPGVLRARIGTGHPFAARLLAPLRPVCGRLGWRIRAGGWVDFTADQGEPELM